MDFELLNEPGPAPGYPTKQPSETSPSSGSGPAAGPAGAPAKRHRVLLSCAPCRLSKLKCDRLQPCSQCLKKAKPEGCLYAPKPEKHRPAKSMAARLKRLEGMVRNMMENPELPPPVTGDEKNGNAPPETKKAEEATEQDKAVMRGQVVRHAERMTTYVGATHFMAVLEDIEDLKSYFDDPDGPDSGSPEPGDDLDSPEIVMLNLNVPRTRDDLLNILPERQVCDRLIMRYFSSQSPSVVIMHKPTFQKQYAQFWQDPHKVHPHWLAMLFMLLALGVFFSSYMAPHELSAESPEPAMDRFRLYRTAAGWALSMGKVSQPGPWTLQPMILYTEAEFLICRASQMNCYLLSGVCIRLMLKMGLHRDPSRLAHMGQFEGEMRRRMWNLAVQIDQLVSFHMGLPSMAHGIESDTRLPRNLLDEDFDETCVELPPGRPIGDYTSMTYSINKAAVSRVFGMVSRQAHFLEPPPYSEVLQVDGLLEDTWKGVPSFMKVRPIEESITDAPTLLIQRFGLASLYNKSRCVLHRRYLVEAIPKKEHDYSRRACLDAALNLLGFQRTIWEACQPGHILATNGWFVSSLAVHDFMLAAMVIYLVIKSDNIEWAKPDDARLYAWVSQSQRNGAGLALQPTKDELKDVLRRSYDIWINVSRDASELRKTAEALATMLGKVGRPVSAEPSPQPLVKESPSSESEMSRATTRVNSTDTSSFIMPMNDSISAYGVPAAPDPIMVTNDFEPMDFTTQALQVPTTAFTPSWVAVGDELDWRYFDTTMSQREQGVDIEQAFLDKNPVGELDFLANGLWSRSMAPGS